MNSEFKKIQFFLETYLDQALIDDVVLPNEIRNPNTPLENKEERFFYTYHKIIGPLCITVRDTFGRELTLSETGYLAERLQVFLKESGL